MIALNAKLCEKLIPFLQLISQAAETFLTLVSPQRFRLCSIIVQSKLKLPARLFAKKKKKEELA